MRTSKTNIRISIKNLTAPVGTGLVGLVAANGEILHVSSPSNDPRYDDNIDMVTEDTPNAVLCCPIFTRDGVLIAVLHLCGRKNSHEFSSEDIRLAEMFCNQLSPIVTTLVEAQNKTTSTKRGEQLVAGRTDSTTTPLFSFDSNFTTLCETIENQLSTVISKVDYCSFYLLHDLPNNEFLGATYSQPERFKLEKNSNSKSNSNSIFQTAITTNQTQNVPNVHLHSNYNFELDSQMDKMTQSVLVIPIPEIGAVQILRSRRGKKERPFTTQEVDSVTTFLQTISGSLAQWQQYQQNVSERSERALRKTSIHAMDLAKRLQTGYIHY